MKPLLAATLALLLATACGTPEDQPGWTQSRDRLEDRIEAQLGTIEDELDEVGLMAAAEDSAYVETRRNELKDIQEQLRTYTEKIDDQQQDTWNEFAREVDEYLDEVDDRIAQEWPATP
jgi:GTPase Era involved in 16S rRNA processing